MSYHIMSYPIVSYHILPYCNIISYDMVECDNVIISHDTTSYSAAANGCRCGRGLAMQKKTVAFFGNFPLRKNTCDKYKNTKNGAKSPHIFHTESLQDDMVSFKL